MAKGKDKHRGGWIEPDGWVNAELFKSPELNWGLYGSQIRFVDRYGNRLYIEMDNNNLYVCSPGYERKEPTA